MNGKAFTTGSQVASRRILIIHGYTGSPDEFRDIAELLANRLNAYVSVPLLIGHGTLEKNLLPLSFDDLLSDAKNHLLKVAESGKPFAIIGHSFGGYLALLAPHATPAAVVIAIMPFSLRFPFSIPGIEYLFQIKTFWNKMLSPYELQLRKSFFFYPNMPGIALYLVKEGIRRCKKLLPSVLSPILAISTSEDFFSQRGNGLTLLSYSGHNPLNQHMEINHVAHRVFFGEGKVKVNAVILDFLERAFSAAEKKSV